MLVLPRLGRRQSLPLVPHTITGLLNGDETPNPRWLNGLQDKNLYDSTFF